MKHTAVQVSIAFTIMILLTGCLYPEGELSKNKIPNEAQLKMMQSAVDSYQEQTGGLLPIKTKDKDTPKFRKYLINFKILKEHNIISEIPGTAFENGGIYQYTIIHAETDPTVKLIDLRVTDAIRELNMKINMYRNEHLYPPFGQRIADGVFKIDYKKLGLESEPYVVSPFSHKNLPIVMDAKGKLYVDYRIDLNEALKEYDHKMKKGEDIRTLLAEHSPFVPSYSLPYTIQNGEPVFRTQID
ncbi:hypothetical protein [Virgibacillus siamensis]|uniref:hypothetical protein n=1 Tax=Virgibacillus siamensis TaxID=480071 RepID=UPI0009842F9D|nr:hypothetical protein [Virgibacillus siamensis]